MDKLDFPYKKSSLIDDFQKITSKINHFKKDYFLYRDFQGRNIYIYENQPYFIDFQGGMQGFLGYDLVSLLWQAKANLPLTWKEELKNRYFNIFSKVNLINQEDFQNQYDTSLILRFYQLLGAYGLRGLVCTRPRCVPAANQRRQNYFRFHQLIDPNQSINQF